MSSIEERVKKIVAEQLGVKEDEVQTSASFVEVASPVAVSASWTEGRVQTRIGTVLHSDAVQPSAALPPVVQPERYR